MARSELIGRMYLFIAARGLWSARETSLGYSTNIEEKAEKTGLEAAQNTSKQHVMETRMEVEGEKPASKRQSAKTSP